MHPGEIQHAQVKALGVCLNGTTLCTRLTPERFHRVRQGICGLLLRRRVSGRAVEIILGHATFCALANRRLLSIFNAAYKFVRSSYSSPTPLWSSVRDEFRAFAALMPFLQSDWLMRARRVTVFAHRGGRGARSPPLGASASVVASRDQEDIVLGNRR